MGSRPSESQYPPTPQKVGDTVLGERIAVGGMAEVFRGSRGTGGSDEQVVVKVLLPHYARDEEVRALFRHEAELGVRLHHPHVIQVIEYGDSPAGPYTVARFVDGVPLSQVSGLGALPFEAVLCIAQDLFGALAFVHQATDELRASAMSAAIRR